MSTNSVNLTEQFISGFNTDAVGTVEVTVTYEGQTFKYDITIANKEVESVTVENAESEYIVGDSFKVGGRWLHDAAN